MKELNSILRLENLTEYSLTSEEMMNVRGGENDPIIKPVPPPIIL